MKILVFILLAAFFSACNGSGGDTVDLELNYVLEEDRTCDEYSGDHFLVTVYDSDQRKVTEQRIKCNNEHSDRIVFVLEKGSYYVSVVLRTVADENNNYLWRSYGAKKVDLFEDSKETIEMHDYLGGVIFLWKSSDCGKYSVSTMALTLNKVSDSASEDDSVEETPVKALVWGEEVEIKDFRIPCAAGRFEMINIPPEPSYTAEMQGFRQSSDTEGRIRYDIPKFFSGRGQNIPKEIDKYINILVSDMKVKWEFDSKSIDSCETAGVSKVRAELVSDLKTLTADQNCDNKFSDFYFYDIKEGEYTLNLYGFSSGDEVLFESSLDVGKIDAGHLGDDILEKTIFLKEK